MSEPGSHPSPSREQMLTLASSNFHAESELRMALVNCRESRDMTPLDIGVLVGLDTTDIRAFERYDSDPRLSEIRRYALAVGARLKFEVTLDD